VGFEDDAYFTRRFKQLHGVSPRSYRQAKGR
jgi:AraC-like DNA-binding protein